MPDFEHPRLGKLQYDGEDGWDGWIELPRFAECQSGDDNRNLRNQRRLEEGKELSEREDRKSDYDAEEIDDQIHRVQGQLRLRIQEVGREELSAAQERSLDYLLDHEQEVLDTIVESQFRVFQEILTDELDFRSEFGIEYAVQLPRDITSPEQLKKMMSFSYVEIEGDAIDGFVRIHLSGACDWDEEHGFSLDLLKDRVLGWDEEEDGFPATVPERVDLSDFVPADGRTRPVEFQIYGRWSGIYQIDRDGVVVDRQHCMLCPGSHWVPRGSKTCEFRRRAT